MKLSTSLALAALMAPASAFAPVHLHIKPQDLSSSLDACISKSEILKSPDTTEMGKIWDPLGLAEIGSDETLAWFRHSEVKHGRVAMAAVRMLYCCVLLLDSD
jgi:hypothetical protein